MKNNNIGDWIFWISIVTVCFVMVMATTYEENQDQEKWFTGPSYLSLNGENITLSLSKGVHKLDFLLEKEPLPGQVKLLSGKNSYKVKLNKNWLSITSIDEPNDLIALTIRLSNPGHSATELKVDKVQVNGNFVEIRDLLANYIQAHEKQVKIKYIFSARNIGGLFFTAANYIPCIIMMLMVPMLAGQIIILILTFPDRAAWVPSIKISRSTEVVVNNFVDNMAMPLGLLGTVTALWLAFESKNIDASNAGSIIEIVSVGIFSTFLALLMITLKSLILFIKKNDCQDE